MASDDSPQIPLNDFLGLKEPVPSPAERRARLRAAATAVAVAAEAKAVAAEAAAAAAAAKAAVAEAAAAELNVWDGSDDDDNDDNEASAAGDETNTDSFMGEVLLMSEGTAASGSLSSAEDKAPPESSRSVTFGKNLLLLDFKEEEAALDIAPSESPVSPRLDPTPSTPPRFQPAISTQSSPTSVTETERVRKLEYAVDVTLKIRTNDFQRQLDELARQNTLETQKADSQRLLEEQARQNTLTTQRADFQRQLEEQACQNAEQLSEMRQLLLNSSKSIAATVVAAPAISAAQLEAEAKLALMQRRKVASNSAKLVDTLFTPPIAPLVFSETRGHLRAELQVYLTTMGAGCLLSSPPERLQSIVDKAALLLPFEEIDVPASLIPTLGQRMASGGFLSAAEETSVLVLSVRAAELSCTNSAEAYVQASSPPRSTMRAMLEKAKILQQGQPGIGPLRALALALEPYQADSVVSKGDLLDIETELVADAFDKDANLQINLRTFRARVAALCTAMVGQGMCSSLSDPQAEWSALHNAARHSALGQMLAQSLTLVKLSGSVNYPSLLQIADDAAHDEDKRAAKAAAARTTEHSALPKSSTIKVGATTKAAADATVAVKSKHAATILKANAARSVRCFNCGARDHVSSLCPIPPPPDGQKICWTCGIVGHVATACPSKSSGAEPPKNP